MVDTRLGRHVEHDPRSRQFPFKIEQSGPQVSVRHSRVIPVFDQGQLGSCTGNAGIGCLGTGGYYETVKALFNDWTQAGAVKLYSEASNLDEVPGAYPPEDTGSTGLAIGKALKNRGLISGYLHAFSMADVLAALQKNPIIVGVNWYNSMYSPDANGIVAGPKALDRPLGGHEFILDEVDFERKLFGAQNSWGLSYGLEGRFYLPFALLSRLLSEQGDATIFVPLTQPAPVPVATKSDDQILWDSVKDWAGARHYGSNSKAAKSVVAWAGKKNLS